MVASRAASARDRFPTGSRNASIATLAILTVPAARAYDAQFWKTKEPATQVKTQAGPWTCPVSNDLLPWLLAGRLRTDQCRCGAVTHPAQTPLLATRRPRPTVG